MSLIEGLQSSEIFFVSFCTIFGLMVGSFLNVVIYRLPKMLERNWRRGCAEFRGELVEALPPYNIVIPRSSCPHCGHRIGALENIPLASYAILRGRCSRCGVPISARYPVVELLTGFLSAFIAWHFGFGFAACAALVFTWAMITLAFIDMDTQLLPDVITSPLLWCGLLVNLSNGFTDIHSAVVGAIAGFLSLWLVYHGYRLIARKEGMGCGDFKLLAVIGAWFGWQMLPLVILFSSVTGVIVGLGLIMVTRHGYHTPIAFGPFLAGGAMVALFWGNEINHVYFSWI
ncbi:A24 family peptidase [Nitrosospira sp. Is2]|uniref:prepilin peptidase n=1 Tax=Nitrosospira sp. Is2 TaxID=3080532 RepID=UPI002952BD90|nr:A24 family peptidase [Nitrosospira sp. Is2]WON74601.1 A24 family peptidase [Nitrosospira sp. Is2]